MPRKLVIQTALEIDIVIFEIDRLQPRIAPGKFFFFLQRVEQEFLRRPIDAIPRHHHIALQIIQNIFPFAQNPLSIFIRAVDRSWPRL